MNTIGSFGQTLAMDGLNFNPSTAVKAVQASQSDRIQAISPTGAEAASNIVQSAADVKADAQQLQRMSDMVMGRKLQFNVNKELGSIVVKIVDPSTDQVVKEIPSEEIQNFKVQIRKAIGVLFDEMA